MIVMACNRGFNMLNILLAISFDHSANFQTVFDVVLKITLAFIIIFVV